MHVNDVRLEGRNRAPQVPPCARVEADLPGRALDTDAVGSGATRQLAVLARDQELFDAGLSRELATEQPDLMLPAAPFAAGIDLQNSHAGPFLRRDFHDPGEHAAQRIEFEGLLQEGAAQLFEELQRIAPDRV